MKDRAIISERGTITIPERIRQTAHIKPGDLIMFKTEKDQIILTHMIVKRPDEDILLDVSDWDKFDKLVQRQFKKGQLKTYDDLAKAKLHSRHLGLEKQ